MPLITLDTSVALPATLSPSGLARKLLVILAFGAVSYRAEHLRLEHDLLLETVERDGGEVHGLEVVEAAIDEARRRRAGLAELLPFNAPDDYLAVGFAALFDEHERKLREVGRRLDPPSGRGCTSSATSAGGDLRRRPTSLRFQRRPCADPGPGR